MVFKRSWIRRRWWDARTGHSAYLIFTLTFVNFILIAYRFFIENDPLAKTLLSNLWTFIAIFLISYVPVATLIGYWHRRTQLSVETTLRTLEDSLLAKMFRTILDVQTGRASKEEIEKIKSMLLKIEKNQKL